MITVKKILMNFSWLVADKLVLVATSLITLIIVSENYSAKNYGIYQYSLSICLIASVIYFMVDPKIVIKKYSERDAGDVIINSFVARNIMSLLYILILTIYILSCNELYITKIIISIFGLQFILLNLAFNIECYFDYILKSKYKSIATSTANLLAVLLCIISIKLQLSIIYISISISLSAVIKVSILYILYLKTKNEINLSKFNTKYVINIIKDSLPLGVASSAALIYGKTDNVMIGNILTMDEVAVYSISTQLLSVFILIVIPLQVSIYPKMLELYKHNKEKYMNELKNYTSISIQIYVIFAILALPLNHFVFNEILSSKYYYSSTIFLIHLLTAFFIYCAILRSCHFIIIGCGQILTIVQVIAVLLNIILNYILLNIYGVIGAAIATLLTQGFSLFFSNIISNKTRDYFYIQILSLNIFNFNYLKK